MAASGSEGNCLHLGRQSAARRRGHHMRRKDAPLDSARINALGLQRQVRGKLFHTNHELSTSAKGYAKTVGKSSGPPSPCACPCFDARFGRQGMSNSRPVRALCSQHSGHDRWQFGPQFVSNSMQFGAVFGNSGGSPRICPCKNSGFPEDSAQFGTRELHYYKFKEGHR